MVVELSFTINFSQRVLLHLELGFARCCFRNNICYFSLSPYYLLGTLFINIINK